MKKLKPKTDRWGMLRRTSASEKFVELGLKKGKSLWWEGFLK